MKRQRKSALEKEFTSNSVVATKLLTIHNIVSDRARLNRNERDKAHSIRQSDGSTGSFGVNKLF